MGSHLSQNSDERPEFSLVVPVFDSAASVEELVERAASVFERDLRAPHEIILVDDGSPSPATWTKVSSLARRHPSVRAIRLTRNFGKPAAVICGLAHARGAWVVTIDDDLQHRPEDIPLLAAHREHDVVVAGHRKRRHGLAARVASAIKWRFDRHILHLPCRMSPFKLIRGRVVEQALRARSNHPYIPAMLAHVTSDFRQVEIEHRPSACGRSRYSYRRRWRQFSNLLIGNSAFLLRATALFGGMIVLAGAALGLVVLARWGRGGASLWGWPLAVALQLVAAGVGLMGLGFIGEYLIRIVELSSGKPPFAIRETIGAGATTGRSGTSE